MEQKITPIVPIAAILFALVCIGLAGWLFMTTKDKVDERGNTNSRIVACTDDARLCPDGSAVGRVGPNCEFAACPVVNSNTTTNSNVNSNVNATSNTNTATEPASRPSGWKTYTNEAFGVSFHYPPTFGDFKSSTDNAGYRGTIFATASSTVSGDQGGIVLSRADGVYDPKNVQGLYGPVAANDLSVVTVGSQSGSMFLDGDAGCGGQNVVTNLGTTQMLWISFQDCEEVATNSSPGTELYEQPNLIKQVLSTFSFAP